MAIYRLPDSQDFTHRIDGKNTHLFVLQNRSGMRVAFTDYGARIVSILVPDKAGELCDVALGFNSIHGYLNAEERYHGATIGRYANRIANGCFELNGKNVVLEKNNGSNCLHGGKVGFHSKVWDRRISFKKRIDFYYVSPDGEGGFPANLNVSVSYELTEDNEIVIKYKAESDANTVVNLTNHTYFNLNGEGQGDILNHILQIRSDEYLPVDQGQIPLGVEASVDGTAFDFREPKKIVDSIDSDEEQIQRGNGFDHTFVNKHPISQPVATAFSEASGIALSVFTTEPGVQLYTGNFLTGKDVGKSGSKYLSRTGFCLETQHYPNSPNQASFPSVTLTTGEVFESETIYKFSIIK